MLLDYSGFATNVRGLGPGTRVALWVRGCTIGCPGCMTPELWAKGKARPIDSLVEQLLPALAASDGLTISGGEPFEQPAQVAALIDRIREHQPCQVLSYSGYPISHLRKNRLTAELLARLDLLIDGPYLQREQNTKAWRGSDNQRLHRLSSMADIDSEDMPETRELQIQSLANGTLRIVGIPRRQEWAQIEALLKTHNLKSGGGVEHRP